MDFYSDDAVLVVRPGLNANGKLQIRKALSAISEYFNDSLRVTQNDMVVIEAGDVALVIARAFLEASRKTTSAQSLERKSTYVFRKDGEGNWPCVIDNSDGTDLLEDVAAGG